MKRTCHFVLLCAATVLVLPAQTVSTLYSFSGQQDGGNPQAPLLQAADGNLYGADEGDSALAPGGVLFEITTSGALTTIYNFCPQYGECRDGEFPVGGVIQGSDGSLYGTARAGGDEIIPSGTVFRISKGTGLTLLHSFCSTPGCTDGTFPYGGLVEAPNGNFYGATTGGGSANLGTIYELTPSGTLTTIYNFPCPVSGVCPDGSGPASALVLGKGGELYGAAAPGTTESYGGTIFKITTSGTLTTLYTFCQEKGCPDGYEPTGLLAARDGNFYGTTLSGGSGQAGTVFRVTPEGALITLYSFCKSGICTDGQNPMGTLVEGTDGNFYGTTYEGGLGLVPEIQGGTLFQITPSGVLTTLYNFCSDTICQDGFSPQAGIIQDTNGDFYGTTFYGGVLTSSDGSLGAGTIFHLSMGLPPFVKLLTSYGKAGAMIDILGTDLTGTTSVSFDGAKAMFQVISGSLIVAKVPEGAHTGTVEVTTPNGKLVSNLPFQKL